MKSYNVLFLCTHNSARSILGEAIASTQSNGKLVGYSAGSFPNASINPFARELAVEMGYPAERLRPKRWDEFARPGAPEMDFIITVCDNAAGEACPVWIGNPATAHWGFPDPSQAQGTEEEKKQAFRLVAQRLKERIRQLAQLPLDNMDKESIRRALKALSGATQADQ